MKDKEGEPVGRLTKDAFEIVDGKERQQIAYFVSEPEPLSVALLFDVSKSMRSGDIKWVTAAREAVLRLIKEGNRATEYLLMAVSDSPQVMADWTRDSEALTRGLSDLASVRSKDGTGLYDACYLSIERLQKRNNPRRVMIMVTDGYDTWSQTTYKQLRELLKHSDVMVYSVSSPPSFSPSVTYADDALKEMSSISGGAMFSPSNAEKINAAFRSIASELANQYLIGYSPPTMDGKWHGVKVVVKPLPAGKRLEARARKGYYAVKKSPDPPVPKD